MNELDDLKLEHESFSFLNIQGRDKWDTFDPVFGSLTVIGATSYSGRYRFIGRKCEFQVKFSAATSIASTAGTDYLTSPFTMTGLSGMATMTNVTANTPVGVCTVNVSESRIYLPTQVASGNTFNLAGWFEI